MSILARGFENPVFDAQATFRAMMNALAFPGRIQPLAADLAPPAPLQPEEAALLLALCDADTALYLSPAIHRSEVVEYLRFHTGLVLTDDPATATFAVVDLEKDNLDLASFAQGEANYPDRSTTIIARVPGLSGAEPYTLRGPGIRKSEKLTAVLPQGFAAQWAHNRGLYPLGIDVVLVGDGAIIGLPRTVSMLKEAQ